MSDTSALDNTPEPTPAPEPEELVLDEATPEAEDEFDELEIGPKKYKVEKPIKEAWSGLQKTVQAEKEALKAEAAKIAEERTRTAEVAKLQAALFDDVAELKGVEKQLADYQKLTPQEWLAWHDQDPNGAQKGQLAMNALMSKRAQMYDTLRAKGQELESQNRKTQAERDAAAEKELAARVKEWSPAKRDNIIKYAKESGLSDDKIAMVKSDPDFYITMEKAQKYDQAVARAAAAREAAKKAERESQGEPEPTPKVRANSGASSNIPTDKDPPDVWLKKRQAQLRAANR